MPVSFSSPPRNLFLLGSSGADVVSNFFATIDSGEIGSGYDVFQTDEIRISDEYGSLGTKVSHFLAGTAQDSNSKKVGWMTEQKYYEDYPPGANPPNPPANVAQDNHFFVNQDTSTSINTTLRAMELFGSNPNHVLIVVGKTGSVPWIAKYNENAAIEWVSTSNTADVEYTGVCKGGTNYYACGSTAVSGDAVSFVEKFDSNGIPGWGKSATMLGRDVVLEKITANSRDEIIAVGYLEDDTADKGYIVKIDANSGEILWDRSLERNISGSGNSGGNGNDDIASADVRCTACYVDGNDFIYVVGSIDGKSPVNNGVGEFLVKYSPEGNILWQRENHTDHYTALDGAPNMIPFDVKSDTDTQQTVVLSVEDQGSFASNNSDIFISKYSKDGTLVFRRKISKGSNTLGNASLDADPSFYYVLFTDQQTVPISGTPDRFFFGRVSTSGNGLGDFQYDDGSTADTTPIDYTIVSNENKIGRLSDGSVRNDISDFITYPFTANKLVFDDLATPVSNKKKQMDSADSFEYGGSPAVRPADNPILSIGSQTKSVTTTSGGAAQGQQAFTTAGSFTWTAPANVTSVSVVCVGAGGAGGGALAYKNDITVVPGNSYNVVVGAPGSMGTGTTGSGAGQNTGTSGGNSTFQATHGTTVAQGGITGTPDVNDPKGSPAGDYDGGGNGGVTYNYGGYNGGGAGGYSGDGGGGGAFQATGNYAGQGGGGSNGSWAYNAGGGVGILGEGASGAAPSGGNGFGGSGGGNGTGPGTENGQSQTGGDYGGGSSGRWAGNTGGKGAVRIIWGENRAFPSTNTADVTPSSGPTTTTTTTLIDMSGNGNDGVVNGATIQKFGGLSYNYLDFDGTDDVIEFPESPSFSFTGDFTVESWIYPTSSVVFANIFSTEDFDFKLQFLAVRIYTSSGSNTSATCNLNSWNHVLFYRRSGTFYVSINGVEQAVTPAAFTGDGSSGAEIGRKIRSASEHFVGRIGEVRVYPKALTAAQIFQNYNATKSKYTNQASTIGVKVGDAIRHNGLILHYDFNNKYTYDPSANLIFPSSIGQQMLNDSSRTTQSIDYSIKDPFGEYGGVLKCEHISTGGGYFRRGRNTPLTAGKTYTISLYFKNGTIPEPWEGRATINGPSFSCATFNPTFEAPMQTFDKNTPVGNGWYKQIFTFTPQYSQTYQAGFNISHNQPPLGIFYLAGFQLEEGITDGRFIPTNLSQVPQSNIVRNLSSSSFMGTVTSNDTPLFIPEPYGYFRSSAGNVDNTGGITVPTAGLPAGASPRTMEAWIYMDSLGSSSNPVFFSYGTASAGQQSGLRFVGTGLQVSFWTAAYDFNTGFNPGLNVWFHYVATYDGSTIEAYVNGTSIGTKNNVTLNTVLATNLTFFHINDGADPNNNYPHNGRIGEARIYDRALSSTEVSINYLKTKDKYGL